jgi:acetyl esterase/lipase
VKLVGLLLAVAAASAVAGPALGQGNLCMQLAGTPHTQPSPEAVEGATAHVFRSVDGVDLRLHVLEPDGPAAADRPAVLFFFGGGWMIGAVTDFAPQAAYVAERGAVAILADYRTFCRNGVDVVDEVADAGAAVSWVRGHAQELGIDPARIAVVGGSAGGHLALSTAVFPLDGEEEAGSAKPDLLVLFYPCVDTTAAEEMAFSRDAIAARGAEVSPLQHLRPGLPPTIIFQGTDDYLHEQNVRFCDAAKANGDACELVVYEGAPHGFFNAARGSDWYPGALAGMDEFLTRSGYLPPKG